MTSAADQATPGPQETKAIIDPFLACQPDMRRLKLKIKGVINKKLGSGDNAHPLLKSSSREFFERSEKVCFRVSFLTHAHTLSFFFFKIGKSTFQDIKERLDNQKRELLPKGQGWPGPDRVVRCGAHVGSKKTEMRQYIGRQQRSGMGR